MFTIRFHNNWQQQFYKSTMIFPGFRHPGRNPQNGNPSLKTTPDFSPILVYHATSNEKV